MKSNAFQHHYGRFSVVLVLLILVSLFGMNSCQQKEEILGDNPIQLKNAAIPQGNTVIFWGHETFTRSIGKPIIVKKKIGSADLVHFEPNLVLHIQNGDEQTNLVSSAIIKLDGKQLFGPSDFSQKVQSLSKEITGLTETSELEFELRSSPGSFIDVWIEGTLKPGNAIIDEKGGEIISDDGNVSIIIPPNDISQRTIISVLQIASEPPNIVGFKELGITYRLEPSGLIFEIPIKVKLNYTDQLINFSNIENLGIIHSGFEGRLVEAVASENNLSNHTLEFDINHFSLISLVLFENKYRINGYYWDINSIKWYIDDVPENSLLTEENVKTALQMWGKHTSSFTFDRTWNKSEANIIFKEAGTISFLKSYIEQFKNVFFDFAYGLNTFDQDFINSISTFKLHENDHCNIYLASKSITTDYGSLAYINAIARHIIAHEIGHAIGIAHSAKDPENSPLMYKGWDGPLRLDLHPWDLMALDYHYDLKNNIETGSFTDPRDGKTYKTVKIGTQWWMAENLKATKYRDGTPIPNVTSDSQWGNLTTGAYSWYNNDVSYKNTYGALYNWYAVNTGKLAPVGWHVPTDDEWIILTSYLGGENIASGKLREAGTSHWQSPNTTATNSSGFTALPGGSRNEGGTFDSVGSLGFWWSSTNNGGCGSWYRRIYNASTLSMRDCWYTRAGFSIRCVKD